MSVRALERGEAGFSLVEVLVAFVILALVSLAMIRTFAGTIGTVGLTSARESGLDVAEDVLGLTRAEHRLAPGRLEGVQAGLGWWRVVAPVAGASGMPEEGARRLFRVEIGLLGKDGTAHGPPLLTSLVLADVARDR